MPHVDVQKETQLFQERLETGYFPTERSMNSEVDYAKEKEPRDTEAVKTFTNTKSFEYIKDMR